jgi:hypothetical protein
VDWLAREQGVAREEWKCISPKYGWSLGLKLKKRTVVHLSPCDGSFCVAFILGDRAVKAARQSDLPKSVLKIIHDAPHYAGGRGVRLEVKRSADLGALRKLTLSKLANYPFPRILAV